MDVVQSGLETSRIGQTGAAHVGLRRLIRGLAILVVGLLAVGLHLRVVAKLPIDNDEDNYLLAAQHYAVDLAVGNWADIVNWDYNYEHPRLTKLVYGAALLPLPAVPPIPDLPVNGPPAATLPQPHFTVDRLVSAALGTLEPLPALTSALAVLFYVAWRRGRAAAGPGWPGWLSVGLQFVVGTGATLLLRRSGARFAGWWRAILLLPWAIPEFVGAIIWVRTFDPDFGWLHLAWPQLTLPDYHKDQNFALPVLLIAATWYGFPLIMLAMSAGLKMLPAEVYDAGALDGAEGWRERVLGLTEEV